MMLEYTNPVWPGYLADPFVLRHEGMYYAYGTAAPHLARQADGRFYPVLRSADLVHWRYLGGALEGVKGSAATDYWAPEIAFANGIFYMYYSAGAPDGQGHQIRVACAARPEGPFVDQGKVLLEAEPFSIDPHPFQDPLTGSWYLFFAKDFFDARVGTGTAVVELGSDLKSVRGPVTTVVRASADWQIFQRNRTWYGQRWDAWHTIEGPFVVYHAGRYWCLYSGGSWESAGYGVGYGVADHILGPYVDNWNAAGPSVLRGVPGAVFGPGHNSLVMGPDGQTLFCAYHAWDEARTMRRLCIDPLEFTKDGPRCLGPTCTPQQIVLQGANR